MLDPQKPLLLEFVASVNENTQIARCPIHRKHTQRPMELAIVGKSNVGKSSFLNFLAGQKSLARISRTPGRTQMLNIFDCPVAPLRLVDLPGFGFASVSHSIKRQWAENVPDYLEKSSYLGGVLFLVDVRHPPSTQEQAFSKWLQSLGVSMAFIQTKCDKIHKSQWASVRIAQSKLLNCSPESMLSTSTVDKVGRETVLLLIQSWLDLFFAKGTHV